MKNRTQTTINGVEYQLVRMNPRQAVLFAPKVAKAIASALGDDILQVAEKLGSGQNKEVGAAMFKALANFDPDQFSALADEVLSGEVYVRTDGGNAEKLNNEMFFNAHFSEHPQNYFKVALWAIWENSKDFILGSTGSFQEEQTDPES